jgi:hypothetical protein
MNQTEAAKTIRVTIFKQKEICRVNPPTVEACVNDAERDRIRFTAANVDVLIVLPEEAVQGESLLDIPRKSSKTVEAGEPGVYSYVVVCKEGRDFQSASGNSDPSIIISRRG